MRTLIHLFLVVSFASLVNAFTITKLFRTETCANKGLSTLFLNEPIENGAGYEYDMKSMDRRSVMSSMFTLVSGVVFTGSSTASYADDFESIAARAARLAEEADQEDLSSSSPKTSKAAPTDTRSAYDFSLPVAGQQITFADLIRQEYETTSIEGAENTMNEIKKPKVKAVLVVNMKQDDPIARKNIPELMSLAAKYGPKGFAVICLPTDQGYYEPDTSALIRLKMASEYGYGINPVTVLTDKVNILGTGAHPFMRWIQGTCRTPSGLGKIQGNFEKFLVDGETGLPVRRYPRKYSPYDISYDIEALVKGKSLPPAIANFNEEWRAAAIDSERDTYRFQKGLNVFDQ